MKGLLEYRHLQEPIGRTIVAVCRERFSRMPEVEKLVEFLRNHLPRNLRALRDTSRQ